MTNVSIRPEDLYPFEIGIWWIDEVGDLHLAGDHDDSFDAMFMRHLGQVRVAVTPVGISIKWDTEFVFTEALVALIRKLSSCRENVPVSLDFCFYGWTGDVVLTPLQAVDRILQTEDIRDVDLLYSTRIDEKPIAETEDALPLIRNGMKQWHQSGGRFDRFSNDELARILPRAMIYRLDRKEQNFVFSWIGLRSFTVKVYGNDYGWSSLGQPLDQAQATEDSNYVNRVSSVYDDVWETGEPRYQFVRTLISRVGVEPEWIQYARLVTRCNLPDGAPSLVCLSDPVGNDAVPLPGMP